MEFEFCCRRLFVASTVLATQKVDGDKKSNSTSTPVGTDLTQHNWRSLHSTLAVLASHHRRSSLYSSFTNLRLLFSFTILACYVVLLHVHVCSVDCWTTNLHVDVYVARSLLQMPSARRGIRRKCVTRRAFMVHRMSWHCTFALCCGPRPMKLLSTFSTSRRRTNCCVIRVDQ